MPILTAVPVDAAIEVLSFSVVLLWGLIQIED